ncbi:MAG: hypothetical protein ABJB39_09420 [Chloroflexota bacterium]
MLSLFLRALLAVSIIAAGLVVGAQLRAAREQLGTGQAGSAASVQPTTLSSPLATSTPAPKPSPPIATPPSARTVVPTPVRTPFTGTLSQLSGTVTMGGQPVRNAQVMVYPSDASNHGPTPVPPESGKATTDDHGLYQVALAPGTYRIGVFRDYSNPIRDFGDGYTWVTWYGDGFVIGLGRDLVVSGPTATADISMLRSVKIAGRVIGRDGVGVPGAQLSLSRVIGGITFPFGGGTTDAAGRFDLSHVAMAVTLNIQANGRSGPTFSTVDLDLRTDRTDLVVTVDRGNIVSGTLRDAAGRPLANLDFGVTPTDTQLSCGWCNGKSDAAGHFLISLPSTTVRFRNWPQPSDPDLLSKEYVISGDMTLDPVLATQ